MEDPSVERARLVSQFRTGSERAELLAGRAAEVVLAAWPDDAVALGADELLAELLVSVPIHPLRLERRLTALRRTLLFQGENPRVGPLLARLAIQCHLNDYAWAIDATEALLVARLAEGVDSLTPAQAMALACYRPLSSVLGAEALLAKGWSGPVADVLREQLVAVAAERALGASAPSLTPIRTGVSHDVRAQYEANPYPRWRRVTPMPALKAIFGWPIPPAAKVLFAGCGTGYHAIHGGQRYGPGAQILAVDLSRASLGYAMRKTQEAGLTNISYAQADLLELGVLLADFDAIECSGVLHHLADPFEGARVLAGRLKPGGMMKISLYSAAARANLQPAKALARRYSVDTIRELRQAIIATPDGDPLRAPMRFFDFYSTSALRDLLMHVQEHEMTMADLRRMMGKAGLRFVTFAIGDDVRAAYRAMFPEDPATGDLDRWEEFERRDPMTFRGMYQFWAQKVA